LKNRKEIWSKAQSVLNKGTGGGYEGSRESSPHSQSLFSFSSPHESHSSEITVKKLRKLPACSITEKLNFPIKFDKDAFCLEFNSAKSTTSDCEPTSSILFKKLNISPATSSSAGGRGKIKKSARKFLNFEKTRQTTVDA